MSKPESGTRERILQEAARSFITHGYAESPLSTIAREVGITKASLYYHFPSKDSMLLELVSPLLNSVDRLLEGTPTHFESFEDRWRFMLEYIALLNAEKRATQLLSTHSWDQDGSGIHERIRYHRDRTVALATPPNASDEDQVRALLGMDMLHRELVFTAERMVLQGISAERRQELVQSVARQLLREADPKLRSA